MTGVIAALRPYERVMAGFLLFVFAVGLAVGELLYRRYRRDTA